MVGVSNQGGPDAALIGSAEEDEEPECCHYEAEDRHEHHPAQGVGKLDELARCHQHPHQTPEHLQGAEREVRGKRKRDRERERNMDLKTWFSQLVYSAF